MVAKSSSPSGFARSTPRTVAPRIWPVGSIVAISASSEHEWYLRGLRHGAQLIQEVVGDRHAVAQALGARGHLGVAGDQHGLVGIHALGVLQHVDHLVEILLELAAGAERAGIDGQ